MTIGDDIVITITYISPTKVSLGIDAPKHLNIGREAPAQHKSPAVLPVAWADESDLDRIHVGPTRVTIASAEAWLPRVTDMELKRQVQQAIQIQQDRAYRMRFILIGN